MKRLDVLLAMLDDVEHNIPSVSMSRDRSTLRSRALAEGSGFLEVFLPSLDDGLLTGLSTSRLPRIPGVGRKGALPSLFYALFARVFDKDEGHLLDDPCKLSILYLRQLTRTFKKVFVVCSDDKVEASIRGFVETDRALTTAPGPTPELCKVFDKHFGRALRRFRVSELSFKHGPGATAEGYDSVGRFSFESVPHGFEDQLDLSLLRPSWHSLLVRPPVDKVQISRLAAVPKTATKPRLISIEPTVNQYIQQGLMEFLYGVLDSYPCSSIRHQTPNQEMARIGSLTGEYATIDLSEASDRMSYQLVEGLFKRHAIWPLLKLSRTGVVELPSGQLHPLVKFSSMGSAVNFPLQVMVYTSVIEMVLTRLGIRQPYRVYGDDLIVPTHAAGQVVEELERYGFKVNTLKSYFSGQFRESCGADWYQGTNVTPVYWRRDTTRGVTRDTLMSIASFQRQLHSKVVFEQTASFLRSQLWRHRVPSTPEGVNGTTIGPARGRFRYNKYLQRHEVRALSNRERRHVVQASDDARLMAALSFIGREPQGYDPLEEASRPRQLVPTMTWVALSE